MDDLSDRLRLLERNPSPDMWEEIEARAKRRDLDIPRPALRHRWAVGLVAAVIGVTAVGLVVVAFRAADTRVAEVGVLDPAPRECPIGLIRESPIDVPEFQRLTLGHLPGWLPPGFGLLRTFGSRKAADGFNAYGVWSDERCREVALTFGSSWRSSDALGTRYDPSLPQVGPWTLQADVPNGCSNEVLGKARCLDYVAVTKDGIISLSMMGLDREEGDRVALSILGGGTASPPPLTGTIAYIEGRQGLGPITLLDTSSGSTEQLSHDSYNSIVVAWSPDGSTIAMTRAISEGIGELVLVSATTGEIIRTLPIDPLLDPHDVDWAPDGRSLAFTDSHADLHIIDADGSGMQRILTGGLRALDISWSPDGSEIAFVGDQGKLAVVDLETRQTDVVFDPTGERVWFGPTWSPDGKSLAFSMTADAGSAIFAIGRDGTGLTRLTDAALNGVNPTWAPDGAWIAFEGDVSSDLYAVMPDGSSVVQLTDSPVSEYGPDWG